MSEPEIAVNFVEIVDTIGASAHNIPVSCPKVGGYDTGTSDVVWNAAEWARLSKSGHVHINQSNEDPFLGYCLDVEEYAWTIANAVDATVERKARKQTTTLYIDRSEAATLINSLHAANVSPYLGLADWDLNQAEAAALLGTRLGGCLIVWVQWASPSSNPTSLLPGTSLTLKESNCDLGVSIPGWYPASPIQPQVTQGIVVHMGSKSLVQGSVTSLDDGKTWRAA
jgi:hypothetical protein